MTSLPLILFVGCLPEIRTTIHADVVNTDNEFLANATVVVRDGTGFVQAETQTDNEGAFTVSLPAFANVYFIISADGYETSSFSGQTGEGEYDVDSGTLWLRTEQEITTLHTEFEGCDISKGQIDGEVRLYIAGQSLDTLPLVTSATTNAYNQLEQEFPGCYLPEVDEETEESLPSSQTGTQGRFGVFGLDEGFHLLEITVQYDEDNSEPFPYIVYVPENGNVPLYPAYITMFEG